MPEDSHPGVYVEETGGARTIEGVPTGTAGFVGRARRGPLDPTPVTSVAEFEATFGGLTDPAMSCLPWAVRGFFDNGGRKAWIARVTGDGRAALGALEGIEDIALVCAPDAVGKGALGRLGDDLLAHCERRRDRFAVVQFAQRDADPRVARASGFAAAYWPWLRVADPRAPGATRLVPPGGHVLGVLARTDVAKVPRGAKVRGVLGVVLDAAPAQRDALTARGINVLRAEGGSVRVWGGRTTSQDQEWKHVNVRRLLIFLEASIDRGLQWVVFEPNDQPTWSAVRRTVTNFLFGVWKDGALVGTTPDEAFFVRCDRTTTTQDDIDNGRLVCVVGVAPLKPAEFVIFRIGAATCR